ncbi:MAG: hypothetical protein WC686_03340 [Candidatus Shapirobacteria bacterium]|jgi:hypothetical protein
MNRKRVGQIVIGIVAFFLLCMVLRRAVSGPISMGKVRVVILNKSEEEISEVSVISNLGSGSYKVNIPPSKIYYLETASVGEDAPKVTIKFTSGGQIVNENYTESGGTDFLVVCSPTRIVNEYSILGNMFPKIFAGQKCKG